MQSRIGLAAGFAALCLSACGGGGGGGGGTSISVSPATLSFTASTGDAPQTRSVNVSFKGDGVVVGLPPPATEMPGWLGVAQADYSDYTSPLQFDVVAYDGVPPGNYTQTLRFLTGRVDEYGNVYDVTYKDVVVSFELHQGFSVSGTGAFAEVDGDPDGAQPVGSPVVQILGDNVAWRVTSKPDWATVTPASGAAAGSATLGVSRGALGPGTHSGEVFFIDDVSGRTASVNVSYTIRAAQLTVSAAALDFTVDAATTPAQLQQSLTLSDELDGAADGKDVQWAASASAGWFALSATSGETAPPDTVNVTLDPAALETLAAGTYNGTITITTVDSTGGSSTRSVPVALVLNLPLARAATPYLVAPQTPGTLVLRGEAMLAADGAALRLGSETPTAIEQVSETEWRVSHDGLDAGEHLVRFANASGLTRSFARVAVQAAVQPGAANIPATHAKAQLVFDAERGVLYAVDSTDQEIERYQWTGSQWNALDPVGLEDVVDIALDRSGRDLVAITGGAVHLVALDEAAPAPRQLPGSIDRFCGHSLNRLGVLNSAKAIMSTTLRNCSGHTYTMGYDLLREKFVTTWGYPYSFSQTQLAASRDGAMAAIGENGTSQGAYGVFSASTEAFELYGRQGRWARYYHPWLDVDATGSKVLIENHQVRARDGTELATLPYSWLARLHPDGTKAYAYFADGSGPRLEIYDLTATPLPGNVYPKIGEIALPAAVGNLSPYELSMLVSDDGSTIFVAGTERILAVPISP